MRPFSFEKVQFKIKEKDNYLKSFSQSNSRTPYIRKSHEKAKKELALHGNRKQLVNNLAILAPFSFRDLCNAGLETPHAYKVD